MSDLREAAQQALEALDAGVSVNPKSVLHDRLRAALAQQEQDTAVHITHCNRGEWEGVCKYGEEDGPALAQQEPLAGMSEMNRTIAYCAAAKLRELGYEWDGQAWAALAQEEKHRPGCALLKIPSRDCDCRQEQEPVAWMLEDVDKRHFIFRAVKPVARGEWETLTPLYTHPPRREWQSLTDREAKDTAYEIDANGGSVVEFARAIEAKLKEKNNG
jgi:hypothetical protein